MGFFRGGGVVVLSIILFIMLLLTGVFLTLSWSLRYENVQTSLVAVAQELTGDQFNFIEGDFDLSEQMEEARDFMDEHCQDASEYVFSEGGYTFVIPCDILEGVEPGDVTPDAMIEAGIETIVDEIYYDDYDCGFWACLGTTELPVFLVSEKAQKYWRGKFWLSLLISLVLIVLLFFLITSKMNLPIVVGGLLVISSLVLSSVEGFVNSIIGSSLMEGSVASFVGIFFGSSGSVFWIMLILGIILVGGGIALRFLAPDSIKKKLSKKDVRKIVKKK